MDGGVGGENYGWTEAGKRASAGAQWQVGGGATAKRRGQRRRLASGRDDEISSTVEIWVPVDETHDGAATNLPAPWTGPKSI
jgi:hypothetical protein